MDHREEDESTTVSVYDNLIDRAITRLSDEASSAEDLRQPINSRNGIDHHDETDDNDDDDDDDEKKCLLSPTSSSAPRHLQSKNDIRQRQRQQQPRRQKNNSNMVGGDGNNIAASITAVSSASTSSSLLTSSMPHRLRANKSSGEEQFDADIHIGTVDPTPITNNKQARRSLPFYNSDSSSRFHNDYDSEDDDNDRLHLLKPETGNMGLVPEYGDSTTEISSNSTGDLKPQRKLCINWYIYIVTALSAIGGFLFGYDTGIVSGAMVFIRDYFNLSTLMIEIVVSVTILTAWIFSLIAGYLTNKFGRKMVIISASFVFTVGGLMLALAQNEYVLVAGRAVVGLAIGLASMAIPVYIAEVAPVKIRGKLVSTNTCFITFGQFIASIVAGLFSSDQEHGWRWMLGLASVPAFLQLVFFFFLPESPRWLIQKQRYDEAFNALRKFRYADTHEEAIRKEFENIKQSCLNSERERNNSKSIRTLLSNPVVMKALFVGSLLSIFQQVAGINTVMYYSATIIQMSGVHDKSTAVWLSALTASINFIFSFVGLVLVERLGRRLLTLSSLFGVIFSLVILGVGFQLANIHSPKVSFHDNNQSPCSGFSTCDQCVSSTVCGFCFYQTDPDSNTAKSSLNSLIMSNVNGTCLPMNQKTELPWSNSSYCINGTSGGTMEWTTSWCPSQYSWMTLAGLMLYLFFFAPGMGPMPWTINSEIYPLWARSFCYSVSTSFNWFFNLLVSLTFLSLTHFLTIYGAFYLYAGLAFFGWVLFFFFLPETKGRTLEEIGSLFEGPLCELRKSKIILSQLDGGSNTSRTTMMTSSTNNSSSLSPEGNVEKL